MWWKMFQCFYAQIVFENNSERMTKIVKKLNITIVIKSSAELLATASLGTGVPKN